ncbi:MAG: glycosyltransferase [Ginsengibacter sp.]
MLVAPLDWGLGHATRCIPIIKELLDQGCQVLVAGPEAIKKIIWEEFPNLSFLPLRGYRISLARKTDWFLGKMLFQFPKIVNTLSYEKRWLKRIIKTKNIDIIISDNRPGLYSKKIPSIYITHQLTIKTNSRMGDFFSNKIHRHFIKKYTACWVPDFKENGLAGELSHLTPLPQNVVYIGALSRLEKMKSEKTDENSLVVLLSGPEPQRTILEEQLFAQLTSTKIPVLFIRGIPTSHHHSLPEQKNILVKNYLNSHELNKVLNDASLIISRSGYTSIMDYVALQKKALLIATPGQAEQEYLASYLEKKKFFLSVPQQGFDLNKAHELEKEFVYDMPAFRMDEYKKVVTELVANLKSGNFAPTI